MKKIILTLVISVAVVIAQAQPGIPQAAISNFAAACEWQVINNQNNNMVIAQIIQSMLSKGIDMDKAQLYLVSCDSDEGAREHVFEGFYSITGNEPDTLTEVLNSWGVEAGNAKTIGNYIVTKYNRPKGPVFLLAELEEGLIVEDDEEPAYEFVKNVSITSTEHFFQGVRQFAGHVDELYKVAIKGTKIVITDPNNDNEVLLNGTVKGGKILTLSGAESKFRYKAGLLYFNGGKGEWYVFRRLAG